MCARRVHQVIHYDYTPSHNYVWKICISLSFSLICSPWTTMSLISPHPNTQVLYTSLTLPGHRSRIVLPKSRILHTFDTSIIDWHNVWSLLHGTKIEDDQVNYLSGRHPRSASVGGCIYHALSKWENKWKAIDMYGQFLHFI